MKLHHSALLVLAFCSAASMAVADVSWDYANETTFNYSEGNVPDIPSDNGTITKTGSGTVILALPSSVSPDSDSTIGGTASDYTGDVYINAGAIRFGSKTTNYDNELSVSPDALGSTGTIHIASGAQLQLGLAQHKTVAWNKSISLEGGTLYLSDGNYTFSSLSVTQSSKIESQWSGKSHTFDVINASGQELTLTGQTTNYTINGSSEIGTLNVNNNQVKVGGSVNIGTITVGAGGTLWSDGADTPLNYDTLTLKGGAKLRLDNGNYWGTNVGNVGSSINIEASADSPAIIAGGIYGASHIRSTINGTGVLELRRSEHGYQNAINLDGAISGDLAIVQKTGNYNFNTTNSYTGGTTIMGNSDHKVTAAADGALGRGDVTLVGSGTLVVSADKTQTNTVNFKADETTTNATLTGASWEGTTLTGSSSTDGSMTGGQLVVQGTFSISGTTLTETSVSVNDGGSLVALGTIGGDGSALDVVAGGALDLTGATTLNVADINLQSGATVIVGDYLANGAISYTGNLNIAQGVIFDLSAWCKNSEADEGTQKVFTAWQPLFTYTGSDSSVLAGMAAMDGIYVTIKLANDYSTQYGTLRLSEDGKSLLLVPEPTTATLSLLALAGLAARRRRK